MSDEPEARNKNAASSRKGRAVEQLVAAMCVLGSRGQLNALTSMVDDEGVDLSFRRLGRTTTLDVQVKARFSDDDGAKNLREKGSVVVNVGTSTFTPRDDLALLVVAVNAGRATIEHAWLIPSWDLDALALPVLQGKRLRVTASVAENTKDRWRTFRMSSEALPTAILAAVDALDPARTIEPVEVEGSP